MTTVVSDVTLRPMRWWHIADIRLAATLEFLRAIDYAFPEWTEEYMARTEEALGDAYTEPAQDVRDYVAYVKSQAAAVS